MPFGMEWCWDKAALSSNNHANCYLPITAPAISVALGLIFIFCVTLIEAKDHLVSIPLTHCVGVLLYLVQSQCVQRKTCFMPAKLQIIKKSTVIKLFEGMNDPLISPATNRASENRPTLVSRNRMQPPQLTFTQNQTHKRFRSICVYCSGYEHSASEGNNDVE